MLTNDVEKRWHDPRSLRSTTIYVAVVIGLVAVVIVASVLLANANADQCRDAAFFVCQNPERLVFLLGPPTILLLGGLGAFVQTLRVWRAGGSWFIWQGAGWALFVLMVVYMTASAGVLRS
ncbi:MAG: hypothetical protein WBQ44_17205 [Rhodococcus sp. (in: high G+C Gram-positive bacteria)]